MLRLIIFLLLVLLGINGVVFWKARASEPASRENCQVVCSAKPSNGNNAIVLPGSLVVFM
ncbi:MAG: hypothetical protein EOO14_24540 [Chitinophagaceae bacterium]|nr:MAG: hypothetical protein EOO14_24540 [Chitinophagaceae bacterium]